MVKKDFEIAFSKQSFNEEMRNSHYHDYYEIYYLFSGERYYYIENRTYHITKGSLVFVRKNAIHKTLEGGKLGHNRAVLYFSDDFIRAFHEEHMDLLLSAFKENSMILKLNNQEQNYLENLLFQLNHEYMDPMRPGRAVLFEALLTQILVFSSRKIMETAEVSHSPVNPKMEEVIQYCNENFKGTITLEAVSSKFFISNHHLSRTFKKYTGFNFNEYINILRIREAQRLLRETSLNVTAICEQVGYLNITHFNRRFKQISSMSPTEYKKMIQSASPVT